MDKHTIYPDNSTPEQVIDKATQQLPITSKNELIGVLKTYHNSLATEKETKGKTITH